VPIKGDVTNGYPVTDLPHRRVDRVPVDGTVNAKDFTLFPHNLGQRCMMWDDRDFNYDGTVNIEDFTLFSHNLGQSATLSAAGGVLERADGISLANVPEPASAGIMVMAGLGILRRRRRVWLQPPIGYLPSQSSAPAQRNPVGNSPS
jgi:hypothetical protein